MASALAGLIGGASLALASRWSRLDVAETVSWRVSYDGVPGFGGSGTTLRFEELGDTVPPILESLTDETRSFELVAAFEEEDRVRPLYNKRK